jgi:hypothetical protein
MVGATSKKSGKKSRPIERREDGIMIENQQDGQLALSEPTRAAGLPKPLRSSARLRSDRERSAHRADQTEKFHPQGVQGLYLAIVNRAILDVLENGENSAAAERWLLSRDFNRLQELFG